MPNITLECPPILEGAAAGDSNASDSEVWSWAQVIEVVWFGRLRIGSLLFTDDVILFTSSSRDLSHWNSSQLSRQQLE